MSRWIQGYACAVAILIRTEGGPSAMSDELLKSCGLTTIKSLKDAEVEPFDIEIITPSIKAMQRQNSYRKKSAKTGFK